VQLNNFFQKVLKLKIYYAKWTLRIEVVNGIFTREYTKCTAGSTFCFVVVVVVLVLVLVLVVVVVGKPLIKLAGISADS
jgi:hypothetical protein